MMFDLKSLNVEILKKFDGTYNYFNPSNFNGRTIFRRETKFDNNKILVSDLVDDKDQVILQHGVVDNFINSYEDCRFINENEISVCMCKRYVNDILRIHNVEFKRYNLITKHFTHYKTQNTHFEKHWQFYNDKIIYHINPYTIFDFLENINYRKNINLNPWIDRYGKPGLSTNVFEVFGKKYILFHSYISAYKWCFKYFVGVMHLNDDLHPLAYSLTPLLTADRNYSDNDLLNALWSWRKTELCDTVKYEVIFPMTVNVDNDNLNIYCGLNDCSAANIKIDKGMFVDTLKSHPFILTSI